jgi:hypothetical protein
MDSVTAVRSQLPQPTAPASAPAERLVSVAAAQTPPPVAATERSDAVRQPAATMAQVAVELAERDEDQHPATTARAAAEAAREAYIKASIAAGISPLPLP